MNIKQSKSFLKLLSITGVIAALSACSSEPSPWTKSDSPWDQRRTAEVEAPAAENYKADLDMPETTTEEVDLSYQTQEIEGYAPGEVMEPEAVLEESPVEDSAAAGGSIMDYPANYYTIQLMASVDIDRVHRFAEKNQLSTEYVVPTIRDGVTWHVLLLNVYPDYSSAIAARDEVSGALSTQPWVRSVGSVQKLMQ